MVRSGRTYDCDLTIQHSAGIVEVRGDLLCSLCHLEDCTGDVRIKIEGQTGQNTKQLKTYKKKFGEEERKRYNEVELEMESNAPGGQLRFCRGDFPSGPT
jgi:hypothetical protein